MSPRARAERRQNRPLREVLDDLLGHAREIARRAKEMTPAELDYAQQRLEWLADEVWRVATGEVLPAKPDTLLFNKVTIKNATQAVQMFGPAQAAVARAVVDSVSSGIIPRDKVD